MTEPRPSDPAQGPSRSGPASRSSPGHIVDERSVQDRDLDVLIGEPLAPFRRVVLAVSGGSDSMALMVLVARWAAAGRVPPDMLIDVATVDHGLRAESAREADWVAERARALGFRHTTLAWSGEKPQSALQEEARAARYALLTAHAQAGPQPAAIVTGHTADDQAETLIMRLGRGSGLDGLSGMSPARPLMPDSSVVLVRPLLSLSKPALQGLLTRAGGTWLDDPSNERLDFERVRLRAADAHLGALGLSNAKLALSARRLSRARQALEALTQEKLAALVDVHGGSYASLSRQAWAAEPAEVRVRLLARLLDTFGGLARPAQLSQIEALEEVLAEGRPIAQTLGGCMVSQGWTTLRLYREPGRQAVPDAVLEPGREILWDRRFRIAYLVPEEGDAERRPVSVRPLGLSAYATLRDRLDDADRPPARAAATLPSVWEDDRLLAVAGRPGTLLTDGRFIFTFLGFDRAA